MKKIILGAVFLTIVIFFSVRVYQVNQHIARAYHVEAYSMNEPADLGDVSVTVDSYQINDDKPQILQSGHEKITRIPVNVTMEVTNKSNKAVKLADIVTTKLICGDDSNQTGEIDGDADKLKNLKKGESTKLTFHFNPLEEYVKKAETPVLVLDQFLYPDLVDEHYQKGERYGIIVQLNGEGK